MKSWNTHLTATACCAFALSLTAHAGVNLVQNGGFEANGGNGQLGFNTSAADWSTSGYNFLFNAGTADTSGASGIYGGLSLWGPGNGSANGFGLSPDGGAMVALDANFGVGALSQTINGLTAGNTYDVSFSWGAAQQYLFQGGAMPESLQVSLGAQTLNTPVVTINPEGFSGWMSQTLAFNATSTSETLSFLASSPPAGAPPFVVLDGVSMTSASAPDTTSTAAILGVSVAALFIVPRLRRART
jgi:hypothetical protein